MIPLYSFGKKIANIHISSTFEMKATVLTLVFAIDDLDKKIQDFYPLLDNQVSGKIYSTENLWQTTCFEVFLKNKNKNDYYEFNFNSRGDWNVFYFSKYRQRVMTVLNIPDVKLKSEEKEAGKKTIQLLIDLNKLDQLSFPCEMNICAVIKSNEENSYWSQKHNNIKPDFHDPDNFSLILISNEGKNSHE